MTKSVPHRRQPQCSDRELHDRALSRRPCGAVQTVCHGSGGAFESPYVVVVELDEQGRAARIDGYDPDHLEQALARFQELRDAPVCSSISVP